MDIVLTVIAVVGLLGVSYCTLILSFLSPMMADSCHLDCHMGIANGGMYAMILAVPLAVSLRGYSIFRKRQAAGGDGAVINAVTGGTWRVRHASELMTVDAIEGGPR